MSQRDVHVGNLRGAIGPAFRFFVNLVHNLEQGLFGVADESDHLRCELVSNFIRRTTSRPPRLSVAWLKLPSKYLKSEILVLTVST